jgi:hypothetical protein
MQSPKVQMTFTALVPSVLLAGLKTKECQG